MYSIRPENLPPDHVLQDSPRDRLFTKAVRNTQMKDALVSLRNLMVVAFLYEMKLLMGELP